MKPPDTDAVARLSRELLIELDTYWSGTSGPSLSGIMLDWRNKYRILLEDGGAAQAEQNYEAVLNSYAEENQQFHDRIVELERQLRGVAQGSGGRDEIRNAALEEAALYHDTQAAHCRAIALCNRDNDLGAASEIHAIDHEIAAKDIREMKERVPPGMHKFTDANGPDE